MEKKTFAIHTLGCKVNSYESNLISALFEKEGLVLVPFDSCADIYIINTCSVTNTGDKKSRQAIHKAKRQNPNAFIAVLGCYAQRAPQEVLDAGAHLVLGTNQREKLVKMAINGEEKLLVEDISKVSEFEYLPISDTSERTRAYIKIQDGCNNFCSYCIIPYTRGRVRSRDIPSILEEAKCLKNKGYKEIVLTGIEVASYGKEKGEYSLLHLLSALSKEISFERIRLSSIDPRAFTDDFIDGLSKIKGLCHHFHISLQSGCTETLKRMNRHYSAGDFLSSLHKIRMAMPDSAITTDIITGFPGETEEEFNETREFIKKAGFSKLHVFPYSERKGTSAAKMEQLPVKLRSERAKILIDEGIKQTSSFLKTFIGKTLKVLFEEGKNGIYEGYTENYIRVSAQSEKDISGEILSVKIQKVSDSGILTGIIDNF